MWQWKREEAWGTGMLTLIAMSNFLQVLMPGASPNSGRFQLNSATHSSPVTKVIVGVVVLAVLTTVARHYRSLMRAGFASVPMLPYLAVAVASIAWSQNADTSLQRVVSLLATSLFAMYFAVRFSQQTQVRMLLAAISIPAVASVVLLGIAPQWVIDQSAHAGAWQGVFGGKNACAMAMVIGVAAGLVYEPKSLITRLWKMLALALFTVIALKAQSSSAVVVLLLMVGLVQLLRRLTRCESRSRMMLCSLLTAVLALGGFVALQFTPEILKLLNRDPTLTGRTTLWAQVWQSILERPMLGYGYGAFWNGLDGPSARIVLGTGWNVPHAHNGLLDVWLCLGLVGVAAFGFALLRSAWRILHLLQSREMDRNLWLIAGIALVLLYNLDESVLILTPNLMWMIFVSCVCGLELYARQESEQRWRGRVRTVAGPLATPALAGLASGRFGGGL